MRRGDHAGAASRLRDLLPARPDSFDVHYLLAVSASHLDQDDEAGREFEWVVAHGEPGSTEVTIARDWLASRAARPPALAPSPPASRGVVNESPEQKPQLASVSGKVLDASGPRARLLLFLKGVPSASVQDESHGVRTDRDGNYHFQNVTPGEYMLTDAVAGPVTWRLRVSLARAERLVLDLSRSNHVTMRDDFPAPRR